MDIIILLVCNTISTTTNKMGNETSLVRLISSGGHCPRKLRAPVRKLTAFSMGSQRGRGQKYSSSAPYGALHKYVTVSWPFKIIQRVRGLRIVLPRDREAFVYEYQHNRHYPSNYCNMHMRVALIRRSYHPLCIKIRTCERSARSIAKASRAARSSWLPRFVSDQPERPSE